MLRKQLLTWLLLPLVALFAVDTFLTYWIALKFSARAYDRAIVETAREISLHLKSVEQGVELDLHDDARQILLSDPQDKIVVEVTGTAGQPLAGERISPPPDTRDEPEIFYDSEVRAMPVRVVQLAVGGKDVGSTRAPGVVRVAETMIKRTQLAREISLSVILPQALLILVAVSVVWIGVVHGLAPLERLRRTVAARGTRDWSPIAADDVPGEVRPLLQAINELVARLDAALTAQNRFISDAAHQLKTPMTVLKTQLELATREEDPVRGREALTTARDGAERMSRVVSQLLSLARNEPEASRAALLQPLDLNALAFEAASAWVPVALKRRIDLGFEGSDVPVMVKGDAARLRELLDNLLDNALRYSHEGGSVTVRVAGGRTPMLQVDDDGPAIPHEERGRIFERFHRLLGTAQGGSGLGLPIAREIARIHDATIDLADEPEGRGNSFCVTFPGAER